MKSSFKPNGKRPPPSLPTYLPLKKINIQQRPCFERPEGIREIAKLSLHLGKKGMKQICIWTKVEKTFTTHVQYNYRM